MGQAKTDGKREAGATLDDPALRLDQFEDRQHPNATRAAAMRNVRFVLGPRVLISHDGAAIDLCQRDDEGVCAGATPPLIDESLMLQKDVTDDLLNRHVEGYKHLFPGLRPSKRIVLLLLQLGEDQLRRTEMTLGDEPLDLRPERGEVDSRVGAKRETENCACVDAVLQAATPLLGPITSASIFGRCLSLTARKSATSLAVMFSWW